MSARRRRELDRLRREANPLGLDLIDAYASNTISRRDFLRRGVVLGVSGPVLASVLAACTTGPEIGQAAQSALPPERILPTTTAIEPTAPPAPRTTPIPTATAIPTPEPLPTIAPVDTSNSLRVGTLFGDPNTGLDPLNMFDLGTYAVVSQSFEYLVGLAPGGFIGPTGLASSWAPNADGTAWTFDLRPDVLWHDGSPFTAADVVASIDRMVVGGFTLDGVVSEGAAEAQGDLTVVVNLDRPASNFPVLLSTFNPPMLITPVDYAIGSTLDERPNGTGPWRLDDYDASSFTAVFRASEDYWGGRPDLDQITLAGFDNENVRVAAFAAGEIDVIQSFCAADGASLLDNNEVTVLSPPSASHRQVWFNTQLPAGGPLTDPRVRQAIAFCVDRQQVVDQVYLGRAVIANDHPVHPSLPFFDTSAVEQRVRDLDRARALLSQAGLDGIDLTVEIGTAAFSEELAEVLRSNCADAGIRLEVNVTPNLDFYGDQWCPGASYGVMPDTSGPTLPCGASAPVGIVDWEHRAIPDVYLERGFTTDGVWNSPNFTSSEFDAAYTDYQSAMDIASQRQAIGVMQRSMHDTTPVVIPAFADYLAGHRAALQDVQATAHGHLRLERARWVR